MASTWVIAVDSSRARIFATDSAAGPLLEIEDLTSPEARLAKREFNTDAHGRSFDSGGQGRHAMSTSRDPKEQETIRFAKRICETLNQAYRAKRFRKLYIVAAPATLGRLRESLGSALQGAVAGEVPKNLATHSAEDIRQHLPDFL